MQNRAFGVLELRSVDDEQRILEGVASTDLLDDFGTVLDPAGARFTVPLPLLWLHQQDSPVGEVTEARVVGNQLRVRAQIRKIEEAGPFKDLTDRAWQGVKHRLVKGFSVGFLPLKQVKNRFVEWGWRELSLVTIPANSQATIEMVRSSFAASGDTQPGVSGTAIQPKRQKPMTIAEQIAQHENSRAAKIAQKQALIDKAGEEGRTLDESESETFDTLDTEIRSVDGHLTRLYSLKRDNEMKLVPVDGTSIKAASESRGSVPVVKVQSRVEPGTAFVRYVMALASSKGNIMLAAERARADWHDSTPEVELAFRAAIAGGTTTNATWAAPLARPQNLAEEFLEFLRPSTLIGKIPGLTEVDFNSEVPIQTTGGSFYWVGEGLTKPMTKFDFATLALRFAKAVGLVALSKELVKFSTPKAETIVRGQLAAGLTQFLDTQFIDPAVAPVANVSPGSITNTITGTAASGTTEAAARADMRALLGGFATANLGLTGVVILMSESMAFTLGTVVNAVGGVAFPGLSVTGGSLLGVPVVTSNVIGNQIIAVHAPSILIADEGRVELDLSEEATLYMRDDTIAVPPAATDIPVSMFQNNMVAIRAERWIFWVRARAEAVRRITGVAYA